MTIITREIEGALSELASKHRALTLLGPRQSGKTTTVRQLFSGHSYISFENPEERLLATEDPRTLLDRHAPPVIFDEIQRVPELLSWIQQVIDENPDQKGQYILTGSHQPQLKDSIAQTLAGRTVLATLLPLSIAELVEYDSSWAKKTAAYWIHSGFYPEIFRAKLDPTTTYRSYFQTYVERDVRQLINIKDQSLFEKFLKLCAGRVGQLLNMNSLAGAVGVSPKTIEQWISVLEASFIVCRLHPYFKNFGKRLIKSPKLYFVDVGLAAYLLNLETPEQVERDPLYGNLFENLIVMEAYKARLNSAKEPGLYFYRDSHGNEVDLLIQNGPKLLPVEIKSSATYHPSLAKSLNYFTSSVATECERQAILYSGSGKAINNKLELFHFSKTGSLTKG